MPPLPNSRRGLTSTPPSNGSIQPQRGLRSQPNVPVAADGIHVSPREEPRTGGLTAVWSSGFITLTVLLRQSKRIEADIIGPIAVHMALPGHQSTDKGGWAVTSVTTGELITLVTTKDDACKVARVLYAFFEGIFSKKTTAEIKAAIPGWVHHWVTACRVQGKYLNHIPYSKSH